MQSLLRRGNLSHPEQEGAARNPLFGVSQGPILASRIRMLSSHSSLRPQRSRTCNRSIRSLHPSLSASRRLITIGLHRCPVSSPPSVSGVNYPLWVLVPPFSRHRSTAPRDVTRCRKAQRRVSVLRPSPSFWKRRRWCWERGCEGS